MRFLFFFICSKLMIDVITSNCYILVRVKVTIRGEAIYVSTI
jgi:hypothetical protein